MAGHIMLKAKKEALNLARNKGINLYLHFIFICTLNALFYVWRNLESGKNIYV